MSKIQAVLFDKDIYTCSEARRWLKKKKYKAIKRVHKTDRYLRYRLRDPIKFKRFTTKKTKDGISFIIGFT